MISFEILKVNVFDIFKDFHASPSDLLVKCVFFFRIFVFYLYELIYCGIVVLVLNDGFAFTKSRFVTVQLLDKFESVLKRQFPSSNICFIYIDFFYI